MTDETKAPAAIFTKFIEANAYCIENGLKLYVIETIEGMTLIPAKTQAGATAALGLRQLSAKEINEACLAEWAERGKKQ